MTLAPGTERQGRREPVSVRGLALALLKMYGVLVVGLGCGLVLYGETWRGRIVFVTLAWVALSPLVGGYWVCSSKRLRWLFLWGVVFVLGLAFVLQGAPDGRSRPGAWVSHRFVGGGDPFPRYALSNLVPEIEQIKLGNLVMSLTDPLIDSAQARRIDAVTLPIYRQMEQDPDFRRLGSVLGWAYADLWGGRFDYGHYYLYLPETVPGEKVPALIFLHGSVGNFKAYLWVWSRLGEARRMAVICPSFGWGDWDRAGGTAAIDAAVTHALETLPIDPARLYLLGLSNGGKGASRVAALTPHRYRGVIFVSPILEEKVVLADDFVQAWRGRPILVLHGDQDRRIPLEYVRRRVAALTGAGVDLTFWEYPGQDHFLLFARRDAVLHAVQAWLDGLD